MIPEEVKKILRKQHYSIVGEHSAVQICRWTKKSLRDEGVCYKKKFYGIKSHRCCQMSPAVMWCHNQCLHCWRAIENTIGTEIKNEDSPAKIIDGCIEAQRKLLIGFKKVSGGKQQLSRANMKKWEEAQEPMQFAISLSGEPMLYNKIGDLIEELRLRKKTSFLVTNGLEPEKISELSEKNQLPTQLYVSVNAPNKKLYDSFHRSSKANAWEKLNETLRILPSLNCRTVFRMNLVHGINMSNECTEQFAEMIKKAKPMFAEIKGYMAVGFARQRLGYDKMPKHEEIMNFAEKIATATGLKILDEQKVSCVCVLGKDREKLKIREAQEDY